METTDNKPDAVPEVTASDALAEVKSVLLGEGFAVAAKLLDLVGSALAEAQREQRDVREVLRGHGHERMAPLAREVQTRINQLLEANDGWFKKAGKAEERAGRARVVRDEALAAVADRAWPFLRDHILGADGAKNIHDAADRALRGVRVSHRAEVLKRMVAFVAACRAEDEKARAAALPADVAALLEEARRLAAEKNASGLPKPVRWVALTKMWSESKPSFCMWCGAAAAKAPGEKADHKSDCPGMDAITVEERVDRFRALAVALAASLEVTATQAQLREKAVEIAVEGFRRQLASMQERLNAANARADAAEAGLAAVRRVVEEHDGEDPIPMVLPTIADEVRARLAAADRKALEVVRAAAGAGAP